ncbi:MAG: ATP-binding protein [Synechococcales bacterium]|nr:ATP-binding protein [Synechococcales bacterium]
MNWTDANQKYLSLAIARIKSILAERLAEQGQTLDDELMTSVQPVAEIERSLQTLEAQLSTPPALIQLSTLFGLSEFEREVLLLCTGTELDSAFTLLLALIQGDPQRNYPTLGLALSYLANPYWSALTPDAPLRYWQLIEIGAGRSLTASPLRIDERVLAFLFGAQHLDEAFVGLVKPLRVHDPNSSTPASLVTSHQAVVQAAINTWMYAQTQNQPFPVLQLCGGEASDRRAVAATICDQAGLKLHGMAIAALPEGAVAINRLARRWQREAMLSQSALLLEWEEYAASGQNREFVVSQFLEEIHAPLLISSRERQTVGDRDLVTFEVALPTVQEQVQLWGSTLKLSPDQLNSQVQRLVGQFNLNAQMIRSTYLSVLGQMNPEAIASPNSLIEADQLEPLLWHACRVQTRSRLENLAQRIESRSTWDDLILPDAQKDILKDITAHLRQRIRVYQDWGLGAKSKRGLGITALFSGASGTGKTLAAEVLAEELRLDLYKIDLSAIISKYIGETEKNLSRVFDAAEAGGAILLFDEADALFGKRNEVKDSHDRYANIEVSYLLQRMETYRGLAILTTNLPDAIDRAFLRRIRFIVQFPFPDLSHRVAIWQRMFPPQTPTEDLSFKKLARLNVAGGNIRNIALNAAFIAANADEPLRMKHLLAAARSEYSKLELPLTEAEIRGWV